MPMGISNLDPRPEARWAVGRGVDLDGIEEEVVDEEGLVAVVAVDDATKFKGVDVAAAAAAAVVVEVVVVKKTA